MSYDLTGAPSAASAPKPRGKGAIITGVVLLVLGLLGVVAGVVGVATTATGLLGEIGSAQTTPATITQSLKAGSLYAVYEAVPGARSASDVTGPLDLQVIGSDITVTAPDGSTVAVTDTGDSVNTIGSADQLFAEVATFDVPTTGTYTITVATTGSLVAVAPAMSSIGRAASWAVVIGVSALAGLIGLVVLIIGIVVRSGSRKAAAAATAPAAAWGAPATSYAVPATDPYAAPTAVVPAPVEQPGDLVAPPAAAVAPDPVPVAPDPAPAALPPAGWYADPERVGGQRWWDGTAWTEHRA